MQDVFPSIVALRGWHGRSSRWRVSYPVTKESLNITVSSQHRWYVIPSFELLKPNRTTQESEDQAGHYASCPRGPATVKLTLDSESMQKIKHLASCVVPSWICLNVPMKAQKLRRNRSDWQIEGFITLMRRRQWNPKMFHKSSTSFSCSSCIKGIMLVFIIYVRFSFLMGVLSSHIPWVLRDALSCQRRVSRHGSRGEFFTTWLRTLGELSWSWQGESSWASKGAAMLGNIRNDLSIVFKLATCGWLIGWINESSIKYIWKLEVVPGLSIGKLFAFRPM